MGQQLPEENVKQPVSTKRKEWNELKGQEASSVGARLAHLHFKNIHIQQKFADYTSQEPRAEPLQQVKLLILQPRFDLIKILIHPAYVLLDGFDGLLNTTELRPVFLQRAEEFFYLVGEKSGF